MPAAHKTSTVIEPRRTILVFQGGGALGEDVRRRRWAGGLECAVWLVEVPPTEGVMVHDFTHSGPATTREAKLY